MDYTSETRLDNSSISIWRTDDVKESLGTESLLVVRLLSAMGFEIFLTRIIHV
jgi:hypothetical protein